jgi:dTDP-4-amino-4,6-dideoxygalactose transaminase
MRKDFLHFSPPLIGKEEMAEVIDTLRSDWITTGPKVRRFEEEFAVFIGAPAALAALGIGPGDAVITAPMTFCSSVHVIAHAGARPVLVDVEPDTLNIDPQQVEAVVTQLLRRPNQLEVGRRRSISPSTPPRTSPPPKEGCLPARLSSWTRPASGACTG